MAPMSRLTATAVAAALLAVAAAACAPSEESADAKPAPPPERDGRRRHSGSRRPSHQPQRPGSWADALKDGGWKNWDTDTGCARRPTSSTRSSRTCGTPDRMREADGTPDKRVDDNDLGAAGPGRAPTRAGRRSRRRPWRTPYHAASAAAGKVFFDMPRGHDGLLGDRGGGPGEPGQVATWCGRRDTACTPASTGGWYRNIAFVPSYNDAGLSGRRSCRTPPRRRLAPTAYGGRLGADLPQWIDAGGETGGKGRLRTTSR